jgi:hypothetical protein
VIASPLRATGWLFAALLIAAALLTTGCASNPPPKNAAASGPLAPEEMALRVQSVADRFISREAQAYQDIENNSADIKVRSWAGTTKVRQALAAMSIATGPNPYENSVNLVVMISLKRASLEANEAKTLLTPQEAAPLIDAYRRAEDTAWLLAERALTPSQVQEVRDKIDQFLHDNTGLRYTGFVRFTDLSSDYQTDVAKGSAPPGSLLALFFVDPFAGLDPTTRELHQTRILIERAAYLFERMPLIVQWQTHEAMTDLLEMPESQSVVTATTRFAAATDRFADATAGYPQVLKTEREAAIAQLAQAVDAQRKAAMADIDSQQSKLRGLLADVKSSLDRAEQAGVRINGATVQTVDATEAAARRTVQLTFWLSMALLGTALVGIPLSALVYRRITRQERAQSRAESAISQ